MDLQTRVVNILKTPAIEWARIAAEPATVNELMVGYAVPLAGIPAVAGWLGRSLVGVPVPFVGTIRIGIVRGLVGAILGWAFALVGVYVTSMVVEKLAPQFRSRGDLVQAMKLVVYSYTPVWIASVLNIFPPLGGLVIIAAFYSMYVFYLGLPPVMGTPQESVIPYMVVAAIVIVVVMVVLGACAAAIAGIGGAITL